MTQTTKGISRGLAYYRAMISDPEMRTFYLRIKAQRARERYRNDAERRERMQRKALQRYYDRKEEITSRTHIDGNRLRRLREAAGLSYQEAARACGVTWQRIKATEQRNRYQPIAASLLDALARAYGCDAGDFFSTGD